MSNQPITTHPSWRQALYGHLALARISNSPTVVSNTLAGAALAGSLQPNATTALVALAMVLFYTAGMYLNDLLDYTIDCRERPERPLPAGIISRLQAGVVSAILFASGSALLWYVGLRPFLGGLVLIGLILCYDRWHKRNPLSPVLMASCRLMVYVIAFLAFSAQHCSALRIPGGLLVLYVVGLTYLAKMENQARVLNIGIVATLFLPLVYFATRASLLSIPLLLCFTAWVAYSVSFAYRSPKQIGRTVGQLIAGISLLDALVLATAGSLPGMLLALGAFALTPILQRYVRGT